MLEIPFLFCSRIREIQENREQAACAGGLFTGLPAVALQSDVDCGQTAPGFQLAGPVESHL